MHRVEWEWMGESIGGKVRRWTDVPLHSHSTMSSRCKGNLTTLKRILHSDLAKGNPK
jgi:hypothetical protein